MKCWTAKGGHAFNPPPPLLNDDTKILTETDTKTFFRYQIFRNRTVTFFPRPNSLKPKPRLFFRDQNFPNQNRDFFLETKFSETDTETLKKLAKVSKPRSFETEMSISAGLPMI